MMKHPIFWAGAAFVALAVVALSSYFAGAIPPDSGGDPDPLPTREGEPIPPSLTESQRQEAQRILESDERLGELLGDVSYEITSVGVWHTADLRLIGAGFIISLNEPKTFDQTVWPQVDFAAEAIVAGRDYARLDVQYGVTNVTEIEVLVDLRLREVVEIEPMEFDSAQPPADFVPVLDDRE